MRPLGKDAKKEMSYSRLFDALSVSSPVVKRSVFPRSKYVFQNGTFRQSPRVRRDSLR